MDARNKMVISPNPACHREERSDVAISRNPACHREERSDVAISRKGRISNDHIQSIVAGRLLRGFTARNDS